MATQMQNLDDYDFAAAPQTLPSKPKYRESTYQQDEQDEMVNPYDELTDIPPDDESQIRPDFYIDRPPTPQYRPKERGVDVATQIEHYEPELFDFLLEVEPVLQVIVGRTIEQARMELIEEEERATLKQHKATFEKKRKAELMVTQRMEAAYNRRKEERERRRLQHDLHNQQLKLTQMKLISRQLSKLALRGAKQRILGDLEHLGYLRDDKLMVLRQHSLPWLIGRVMRSDTSINRFLLLCELSFEQFVLDVENRAANEHQSHYKREMASRAAILADRERVRIEKEERKQRKIEIKRRRAIKAKRDAIRQQVQEVVLNKSEPFENVLATTTFEGVPDPQQAKPYTILSSDWLVLLALSLDFIIEDQAEQVDDQTILNLWIDLLTKRVPGAWPVVLSSAHQEYITQALLEMEQDPYLFNKHSKAQCIEHVLSQPLWASHVNNLAYHVGTKVMRHGLTDSLLRGFFDIYFKSINYRDPVVKEMEPMDISQIPADDDQGEPKPHEEPAEPVEQKVEQDYEKPEITELDLEMVEARKKIQLVFREAQQHLPAVDAYLRLFIPFHIPQVNNSTSQVQNSHELSAVAIEAEVPPETSKWDFDPKTIDIYDGAKPMVREGRQVPLEDESGQLYNFTPLSVLPRVLVQDQRANHFARKHIYHILRERLESFVSVLPEEQFQQRFEEFDRVLAEQLEHQVKAANPDTPIFDYEL